MRLCGFLPLFLLASIVPVYAADEACPKTLAGQFRVPDYPLETVDIRALTPDDLAKLTPAAEAAIWDEEEAEEAHAIYQRKQVVDKLITVLSLPVTVPMAAVLAVAVRLDSGGPVFFLQKRVGYRGKPFTIYKFRTMNDLPDGSKEITRIGRVLRRLHIDELPQLLNVLIGNMSLVGPRPHVPEEIDRHTDQFRQTPLRLLALPGMLGSAGIICAYNEDPKTHLEHDLAYVKNPSFWHDIKILAAMIGLIPKR